LRRERNVSFLNCNVSQAKSEFVVASLALCIFLGASTAAQAQAGTFLGFDRNHYAGDTNLKSLNPATSPDPSLGGAR
jgi:hypothetical protein